MNRQSFPVALCTYEFRNNGTEIYFPQIIHHHDSRVQQSINREIERGAFRLMKKQEKEQDVSHFDQMIGTYEIKMNERNILSLTLSNYAIHEGFAHGLTIMESFTFDLGTGKNWMLSDLFMRGSDYQRRLARIVNKQIEERNIVVFNSPVTVNINQDFYLADKTLVVYYQLYEISPYYIGLPMFPIVVYQIDDLFDDNSLLSSMLN